MKREEANWRQVASKQGALIRRPALCSITRPFGPHKSKRVTHARLLIICRATKSSVQAFHVHPRSVESQTQYRRREKKGLRPLHGERGRGRGWALTK